jgi:hypothetical protein
MKAKWLGFAAVALLSLIVTRPSLAEDAWRAQAVLEVQTPGLIEAVLPPGLVGRTSSEQMDLALIGPDNRPRAFELYWREPVGPAELLLEPLRVQLDPAKGFIWETELHEKLVVRRIDIRLAGKASIGKIDVYGRLGDQWSLLVRDAAVFSEAGVRQAAIDLPPAAYDGLRLHLTGYDRSARQTLAPIQTVRARGERMGKDYAEQRLDLTFRSSESEGTQVIEAVLPGGGLWIGALHLKTEAQFQGRWQVGRERISGGRRQFEALLSGQAAHVDRTPQDLPVNLNQAWPGRSLVIKLDAGERYIGAVTALTATVRLPRLVFLAEKPGLYTARTGTAKGTAVLDYPGDRDRQPQAQMTFSTPEANPRWRLASLAEKYQLKGGPFNTAGYTWRAPLHIAEPGFYRLALNLKASLAPRRSAVRIIRDDLQVPYVAGRLEDHSLDLEITSDYDTNQNISTWTVHLPQASPHWETLTFFATGIFKRTIEFKTPKPGSRSWHPWRQMVWESRAEHQSALRVNLHDLPADTQVIRLVMPHGDNQPVAISRITAGYTAPTVYFLAHAAGDYTLYGGNPEANVPQYDLSLVQAELFSALPIEAQMGELETFRQSGWQQSIRNAFKESGWGLYAVLGLVTLVLLIVIVRLFPKPGDKAPS